MKKAFKYIGITLGVMILLVALLVGYAAIRPMKTFSAKSIEVTIPTDSATLAHGEKLVKMVCSHCHLGSDGKLSGRKFTRAEDPFGEMFTSNITSHKEYGIGSYEDGQLAYLFRTGINKDGRYVGNMMSHPNMSDVDMTCIIAFLRSENPLTAPSDVQHNPPAYLGSAIIKAMALTGMFKPLVYDGKPIPEVDKNNLVAYGKYLVDEIYECSTCHSENFESFNSFHPELTPGYMAGGNPIPDHQFNEVISSNLTMSKEFGIGNYTEEALAIAIRDGNRPDGNPLTPNMPRFTLASNEEIHAIWAYLQTIAPVDIDPTTKKK